MCDSYTIYRDEIQSFVQVHLLSPMNSSSSGLGTEDESMPHVPKGSCTSV